MRRASAQLQIDRRAEILAAAADTLGVAPPALEHAVRRWKCVHAHACDTVA